MTTMDCLTGLQKALGREFSDNELAAMFRELNKRARDKQAEGIVGEDSYLRAANEIAQEQQQRAIIEKRNAALNRLKRLEMVQTIRQNFADDPVAGMEAIIAGVNRDIAGGRYSADAQATALADGYLGGLLADLQRADLLATVNGNHLDRQIAQEMWEIDRPDGQPGISGSKDARRIAEIFAKYQELARLDANAAGAWIGRLPGYIVRQSHDMDRIKAAGFKEWRDYIRPRLDSRTFDNRADPEAFLEAVYEGLSTGVHLKSQGASTGPAAGPGSVARQMSQDRLLHFKDSDSWFDYHQKFGRGDLTDSLVFGLRRMGRATGLMRAMGPNSENNLRLVMEEVTQGARGETRTRLAQQEKRLLSLYSEVDGSTDIPANLMGAKISNGVRAVQTLSKLGAATLSAITDIPFAAAELRYQGKGYLSSMLEVTTGLIDGATGGGAQKREIASTLGVFYDGMVNNVLSRFSVEDGLPGTTTLLTRYFFKLNGLEWWTDTVRASAAQAMGHRLAMNAGTAFNGLEPDLQRVLRLFDIGEAEWKALGATKRTLADGEDYLVPEAVAELSDDAIKPLVQGKVTQTKLRAARRDLEAKLRAYYTDRSRFAVIEPDARTRAFMRRGTRPGTVEGELLRFIGQFKAFPIAVLQRAVGREIYGRGAGNVGLATALRNGNGEIRGLAQLILWSTVFGYGAMSAKDIAKNRTPRNPEDPATWVAAMLQGGALGIYGDFMFGEMKNRFGGTPLGTLLGPTYGSINDLLDLGGRIKAGDDVGVQAWRFITNHLPFANIFYTRMALDGLILNSLQEAITPGYMKRLEERLQRENQQELIFPNLRAV